VTSDNNAKTQKEAIMQRPRMDITPQVFNAKVMHKRLFPKENAFVYGVYYLALPLPAAEVKTLFLRFDPRDLGFRDGRDPGIFAKEILTAYGFEHKIHDMMLITMPRVLGYVFNPVSFYFCFDENKQLLAVIAEVHNTFGEQHTYFCAHPGCTPIQADEWFEAEKVFHVSPFLPRNGSYRFRFSLKENTLGIWIDYFDADNNKQLITSLIGTLTPLNASSLNQAFWAHPCVTLKTIALIHFQALKLFFKKITYFKKPEQDDQKLSATSKVKRLDNSQAIDNQ
jgi:DUF1365 family protein